jgi:hypothetical protein
MSTNLMAERLESLKAGILASFCITLAFVVTTLVNSLLLEKYFEILSSLRINTLSWRWWVSAGIASFCGLLFGVTYRYIIRSDNNPQLKAGGVFAFGLVRGLTVVDVGLSCGSSVLPLVVFCVESIFWFGFAAIILDTAIQLRWVQPFKS